LPITGNDDAGDEKCDVAMQRDVIEMSGLLLRQQRVRTSTGGERLADEDDDDDDDEERLNNAEIWRAGRRTSTREKLTEDGRAATWPSAGV